MLKIIFLLSLATALMMVFAPRLLKRMLGPAVWFVCVVFFLKFRGMFFFFPPNASVFEWMLPVLLWILLLAGLAAGYVLTKAARKR